MFAGFDFKIDSQENLINFSDYVIQGKNHLDSSKADVERNLKEIVILSLGLALVMSACFHNFLREYLY